MSAASDKVKESMAKYVHRMRELGKEPSQIVVTKAQFDVLRSAAGEKKGEFRPRFMGIEVKSE